MTYLLLVNPTSGGGKGSEFGERVETFLKKNKVNYRVISGSSYESARSNLQSEIGPSVQGVIAVGGDGLVHLVIQEIAHTKLPLILIPAGTGNDFARTLKLPLNNPESILERAFASQPIFVDLANVNGEYFAEILSTGFDSVVNERANRMRKIRGNLKYNLSILFELPIFKPIDYRFSIDGEEFTSQAMLIAIANGPSYGGGMLVCPQADINDGQLDIMILRPVTKLEFLRVFPKVFSGSHINHPAVSIQRGREVWVSATAVAYADGERIGSLPISAKVEPGALLTWVF
jgi:diacylglycerol kinase (ATP)